MVLFPLVVIQKIIDYKGISVLVEREENGRIRAYAAWNNKIHGVADRWDNKIILDINKYRELSNFPFSSVYETNVNKLDFVKGEDLYDSLFLTLADMSPIDIIEDRWIFDEFETPSLNLVQYNEGLSERNGMYDYVKNSSLSDKIEVIKNTFSGKWL